MTRRRSPTGAARTFAAPLLIAACSTVGLASALTGDGPADALSWLMLSVPVAVLAAAWARRHRR